MDEPRRPGTVKAGQCSDLPLPFNSKICIVGAGISGLYIALLLQSLDIPHLSIDILEADNRVGGRVYTHRFSDEPYDYYDVGAMRFPRLPPMDRVFDLFHRMQVSLEPYRMNGPNCRLMRNGRIIVGDGIPGTSDPHGVGRCSGGSVPDEVVPQVDALLRQAFEPFKRALHQDLVKGFRRLMEVDDLTAREYLRRGQDGRGPQFDFATIQWMETSSTATGHFDQALTECVLDSFTFDSPAGEVEWVQVRGGTSRVVERMHQALRDQDKCRIALQKRVVCIATDSSRGGEDNLFVQCAGETQARSGYTTVFNTTPLGCLQRMETTSLHLHPMQKEAIRCLRSENSTKVALKFSYPWWLVDCGVSEGGCSSSDLPSRVCVYPSHVQPDKPAVLLASYTWGQDASRIGALVQPGSSEQQQEELVDCVLRDLATLHQPHVSYEKLRTAYIEHHAFCWGNSPFASGAFALFRAGQFSQLYPFLSLPAADGKFHIVGEASSIHHGWVVGALNSAYIAVYRFLVRFNQWRAIEVLEQKWGTVDEMKLAELIPTRVQPPTKARL
ncbi:putative bifunctional amine oxidase [Penicillium rolfsii]|nr:putative bifunctional amine oxidase [Penicillium rolfsii]